MKGRHSQEIRNFNVRRKFIDAQTPMVRIHYCQKRCFFICMFFNKQHGASYDILISVNDLTIEQWTGVIS